MVFWRSVVAFTCNMARASNAAQTHGTVGVLFRPPPWNANPSWRAEKLLDDVSQTLQTCFRAFREGQQQPGDCLVTLQELGLAQSGIVSASICPAPQKRISGRVGSLRYQEHRHCQGFGEKHFRAHSNDLEGACCFPR